MLRALRLLRVLRLLQEIWALAAALAPEPAPLSASPHSSYPPIVATKYAEEVAEHALRAPPQSVPPQSVPSCLLAQPATERLPLPVQLSGE